MSELNPRKSRAMKVYAASAVVLAVMCMVNVPFWWFIAVGVVVIICGFAVMRDAVRNGRRRFGMCFFYDYTSGRMWIDSVACLD